MKKRSLLGVILLLLGIAIAFFIHQGVNCHFRPMDNCKGRTVRLDMDLEDAVTDGNWEAMSGDVNFEPKLQRTINVDIRYVLFVIDKYAGATNLIDELDIHKSEPQPLREEEETPAEYTFLMRNAECEMRNKPTGIR